MKIIIITYYRCICVQYRLCVHMPCLIVCTLSISLAEELATPPGAKYDLTYSTTHKGASLVAAFSLDGE